MGTGSTSSGDRGGDNFDKIRYDTILLVSGVSIYTHYSDIWLVGSAAW